MLVGRNCTTILIAECVLRCLGKVPTLTRSPSAPLPLRTLTGRRLYSGRCYALLCRSSPCISRRCR